MKKMFIGVLVIGLLAAYAAQAVIEQIDLSGYNSTTSMNYQTGVVYNAAVDELGMMTVKLNEVITAYNALATEVNTQHETEHTDDIELLEAY